jgi:DNA-binding transcriptional LysR family regulator
MQWSDRVGRRLKLHELHVLMTVVQAGSMRKAAEHLNTTQPAISRSIAELEQALGVRLLDRSRQGVEPTEYGRALLDCGAAVFDELRQGVKKIEFLSDPTVGEIRVGANEATIAGLLPAVFGRLRRKHPGISLHATPVLPTVTQYRALRERQVDILLGRIEPTIDEDIAADILFHERIFVVAGLQSSWGRRRKLQLSELANEPWTLPPPETVTGSLVADAFRASGLKFPPKGAAMGTVHLFCALLASGPFLGFFPGSMLRLGANLPPLKVLPVDVPIPPWPVGIMTLKNRTISPVTQLFIDCAHEVVKPLTKPSP